MIEEIVSIVTALNSLTPVAIIGLLAFVLFYQAKNNKAAVDHTETLATIKGNDLHELPEMADTLRRIEYMLQAMNNNIVYIKARVNGHGDKE